jgi:hypothetical protein
MEKGLNWELSGVVHRCPLAQIGNLRLASVDKWRLEDKRVALVRMRIAFARIVATPPHPPRVTEEAIKARRPRNLLEDNPASG